MSFAIAGAASTAWLHIYTTYPVLCFWVPSTIFVLIPHFFPLYSLCFKSQPLEKQPKRREILLAARTSLKNNLLTSAFHWLLLYPLASKTRFTITPTLPSLQEVATDFLFGLAFREVTYYYIHRLLHHPKIYPAAHKRHHEFTHIVSFWVFTSWVIFQAAVDHSGFVFPMWPQARKHDRHHELFRVNYGTLGVLDWLHGTKASLYRPKHDSDYRIETFRRGRQHDTSNRTIPNLVLDIRRKL
ncbi:hypothetical protein BDD12DRAFT_989268 [Trichophaea hybrida]|nr:hypothetical protein BDD12DRAFT_989268 [Trichophaea hybrida]